MPHLTSIERIGREQGRREGRQEGRREGRQDRLREGRLQALRDDVLEVLQARFGEVPYALQERVQALSEEASLRALHRRAILAANIADLQATAKAN